LAPDQANNFKNMKTLILLSVVLAICLTSAITTAYAQRESDTGVAIEKNIDLLRRDLRSERKKIIGMNVTMTNEETSKFWPVYDQYSAEMTKINDDFYALIRDYVANQKIVTNEQATEFLKKWGDDQMKLVQTRIKYAELIQQVLPLKKAALVLQVDRRLRALQDVQVSSEFPLITQ